MTTELTPRADIERLLKVGRELGFEVEEQTYAQQINRRCVLLRGFAYTVTAVFLWLERGKWWSLDATFVEVSEDSERVFSVEATVERLREIAHPRKP